MEYEQLGTVTAVPSCSYSIYFLQSVAGAEDAEQKALVAKRICLILRHIHYVLVKLNSLPLTWTLVIISALMISPWLYIGLSPASRKSFIHATHG
jgi:hypothetical protein